jgi:16S rRNA (guanine527-N7)-methyltransferase
MEPTVISALLAPYVEVLAPGQVEQVSIYLDLLLKWNARMNLTAIRDPENIVKRHFGESFFLARHLPAELSDLTDIGSGAGFPAIPIKIYRPTLKTRLVEAQQRKATFLREVARALTLDIEVVNSRVEDWLRNQPQTASIVTFRAVEKFETVLPTAAALVRKTNQPSGQSGTLAILIGSAQVSLAKALLPDWRFKPEISVPGGENRVILRGEPR